MKNFSRIAIYSIPALVAVNILVSCAAQKQTRGALTSISVRQAGEKPDVVDADVANSSADSCEGAGLWSPKAVAGFCVSSDSTVQASPERIKTLQTRIQKIESKFPLLVKAVRMMGYKTISILPAESSASGGAVLGEVVADKKQLSFYETFFTVEAQSPELAKLGFSVADVVLVHEFLHAFDSDDSIAKDHLKLLGWDLKANAPAGGFIFEEAPELSNIWVQASVISSIKDRLGPKIQTDGPWKVYLEARNEIKKTGYPTMYAALGGPIESFAEIGAYIAMDPKAATYIPAPTVKWFKENVLR